MTMNGQPADLRDDKGRFAPGNKVAKGNLIARAMQQVRQSIASTTTPEQAKAVMDSLYRDATDIKLAARDRHTAAKLWLSYAAGAPRDADLEQRISEIEEIAARFSN